MVAIVLLFVKKAGTKSRDINLRPLNSQSKCNTCP